MRRISLTIAVALAGVFFVSAVVLNRPRVRHVFDTAILAPLEIPARFLFTVSGSVRGWIDAVAHWRGVARENSDLKERITELESRVGILDSVQEQNTFLREALGLPGRSSLSFLDAGLFSVSWGVRGYEALLSEGANRGIASGQAVISAQGVLIGIVTDASPTNAHVRLAVDQRFEATARVLGGDATGVARGLGSEGMAFDLIVQGDEVEEGQAVVTTGTDQFPPGLVIGVIEHVESSATQLFKKVRIEPALDVSKSGRVLVVVAGVL